MWEKSLKTPSVLAEPSKRTIATTKEASVNPRIPNREAPLFKNREFSPNH